MFYQIVLFLKLMPLNSSNLLRLLKSKNPFIERNIDSMVSIIRQSITKAPAFEVAVEYLKQRRLQTATNESGVPSPEEHKVLRTAENVKFKEYNNSPNGTKSRNLLASIKRKDEARNVGSSMAIIATNMQVTSILHWSSSWNMSRKPEVLWAQRSDKVYLIVSLPDAKDVSVKCEPEGVFSFSVDGVNGEVFLVTLRFYDSINPQGCKTKIGLRNILCSVQKEQKMWWKRLLKSEEKPLPYIKVDWNRWCDEDDEDSESNLASDEDFVYAGENDESSDDEGMLYLPDLGTRPGETNQNSILGTLAIVILIGRGHVDRPLSTNFLLYQNVICIKQL